MDIEEDFCRNIDKIRGIADLLFSYAESQSQLLTQKGAFGLHYTLEDAAKELHGMFYNMAGPNTMTIELAPTQGEAIDRMVDLTGKSADSLVQLMFEHGFEAWDSLARFIEPE